MIDFPSLGALELSGSQGVAPIVPIIDRAINQMHTTKRDRAMTSPQGVGDRTVFTMAASLSDHEYITVGTELTSQKDTTTPFSKRALDVVLATAMLIVLAPVMILVGVAVALTSRGPIIFSQKRIGLNGREFPCLKFRSMRVDAEQILASILEECPNKREEWNCNQKLKDDPRITPIGAFLRQTSLDELPQLFNVIRGEMSLVGPRPIVASEAPKYRRHIISYLQVKPGLTGMWQISGRNDTAYTRRVAADAYYARHQSLWLDLRIILLTIPAVLSGKGAC